jgi:DHA1 family multidrug resistance protein-like MFS transporter
MNMAKLLNILFSNQAIIFLCISTALMTTGQGVAVPMVPLFADSFGISAGQIGLAVSAFGLARFITNIPAALISDSKGRKAVLVGGPIIGAIGNGLSGFASNLPTLLVFRFIAGIGSAAFITGGVAFISDISRLENRAKMMSIFQGSFLVGISIGPVLGGTIAEFWGLRAPFIVVAILSFSSGIWAFFRVPETLKKTENKLQKKENSIGKHESANFLINYAFLFKKNLLLISLTFAGTFFTRGGAFFTLLPLKASRELVLSEGKVGGFLTLSSIFTFVMVPFVGIFSDSYGRKTVIVPGLIVFAFSLVLLGYSQDLLLFGIGMILYGVAQGLEGPAPIAYVSDITSNDNQAVAQSFARSIGDFSLLSAPPLMGVLSDMIGTDYTLYANAFLMMAISLTFMVFAWDPIRNPRAINKKH